MVAIALIASVSTFAQVTLTPESAGKWFKESYVESNFKDPYSFKLLKVTIDTITVAEQTQTRISLKESDLANIAQKRKDNQWSIETGQKYIKKNLDPNGTWVKAIERANNSNKELDELPETIQKLKTTLSQMSDEEKNKAFTYWIYVECHANNSYGNPVLGRYGFRYDNGDFIKESVYKRN